MLNEAEDAEHFLVVLSHRGSASLCVCVCGAEVVHGRKQQTSASTPNTLNAT